MTHAQTYKKIIARELSEPEIQQAMSDPKFAAYFQKRQLSEFAKPAPEGICPGDEEVAGFRRRLRGGIHDDRT
ncbi:hypothetical protein [Sphingobium sp. DC-2]|uniref:hypothetical protein n=1 Tax=Sphingobium sp. DC-2 TaxID=1303256 RepID=UPI0004C3C5EA|nr:hypothetical protein [Sphingobium sp. DC-2]